MYFQARQHLREQMDTTVLSIASTTAAFVDADLHQSIQTTNDQTGTSYQKLESMLRKARNANRRDDVDVKFIFTLRPDTSKTNGMLFVVDGEETGPDKSNVGDAYT